MSTALYPPFKKTHLVTKSVRGGTKTSSVVLISAAIIMAIVLLMYVGIAYTEGTIKRYSECRDKIIGFEQKGLYNSPEQFKLALSSCEGK